jgi:DNA topoisomerase-1
MASLWPGMKMETLTLEEALKVLSFPREVGAHPDSGEMITAQDGKFGPYIRMGTDSRSLTSHEQLETVTVAEAVELFKQPKGGRRTARGGGTIAELGAHPQSGANVQVKSGRFGPYVTDGVVNATIPKGRDPASLTMEQAVELIAAREQKMRDQGKDPRAEKPKKTARGAKSRAAAAAAAAAADTDAKPAAKSKPRRKSKSPAEARA